jgi:hypothetical protein
VNIFEREPAVDAPSPEVPEEDRWEQELPADPDETDPRLRDELPIEADPRDVVDQRLPARDPVPDPELATPISDRLDHADEGDVLEQEQDARVEEDEDEE